jgi:teichoic acid transport system permease protein
VSDTRRATGPGGPGQPGAPQPSGSRDVTGPPGRTHGLGAPGVPGRPHGLGAPGVPGRPRSLDAPGHLSGARGLTVTISPADAGLPGEPLPEFALGHGLKPAAARPPIGEYLRELWIRRHFIVGFATARNVAMYTEARLGQVWQVLTPLLNVGVYYFIFGVLIQLNRGVPGPYLSFLVTGVFVFNFTQRAFINASRVMNTSLPLIRVLHFPRACLPLGYVLIELQQLMISLVVLFTIVLVLPDNPVTWYWWLIIPVLVLQTLFNVGGGLILARWGAGFDDVSQLLPFLVRTWMYASGVLFSIQGLALHAGNLIYRHPAIGYLLQINPAAVYITLARNALLVTQRASYPGAKPYNAAKCSLYSLHPHDHPYFSAFCHPLVSQPTLWMWGAIWAVAALAVGFVFFWRAETRYGRG